MQVEKFVEIIGAEFYTGVPDSLLKPLCDYLINYYGISDKHIIAANEGNSVALAAGYYLATGKVPVVYLQNSGLGNIINPVVSLLSDEVYAIPCIFVIGWRGEPDVVDEPQHVYQGKVTLKLLEDIDITFSVVNKNTDAKTLEQKMGEFKKLLKEGKSVAWVIRKSALSYGGEAKYRNNNHMKREDIIRHIVSVSKDDILISTTGKASRELYEVRESSEEGHEHDFLTVGAMGHSSSIALGIALKKKSKKIWCIDGDGAMLMHMGAMALIGSNAPNNLIHIVINNGAHETVGGMPTVAECIDLVKIALGCGYQKAISIDNFDDLNEVLIKAKKSAQLTFIEVKCTIGSRDNLGRPTIKPKDNKKEFMRLI